MTKQRSRLKGYLKSYGIDTGNEEQLRWIKIGKTPVSEQLSSWKLWDVPIKLKRTQFKARRVPLPSQYYQESTFGFMGYTERLWARKTENKIRRILKLIKYITQSNKDGNLKEKSELIQLTRDFHKQYESLYSLYDNLRGEIRKRARILDDDESSSVSSLSSDTESFYSPLASKKWEFPDTEDAILKDKLTSTSEIKQIIASDLPTYVISEVPESDSEIQSDITRQKLVLESSWLKEKLMEKEEELLSFSKKHQLYELKRLSQINKLEGQVANLKLEKDSLSKKYKEGYSETKDLRQEVLTLRTKILERDEMSGKKADQFYDFQKIEDLIAKTNDLELKVETLRSEKGNLEEKLSRKDREVKNLTDEFNVLRKKMASLSKENSELEMELSRMSQELSRTSQELSRTSQKVSEEKEHVKEMEERIKNMSVEANQSKEKFQAGEKKIEEMVEELRKQFEDKLKILSRRIRVAEQFQVENKEWYRMHYQEYNDLKEKVKKTEDSIKNVNEMSLTANEILASLDRVTLKFEDFSGNFQNRVSKSSCELKFAKDWVRRKNNAITHVKDDLNFLVAQLDEKEEEILIFRERVWKFEQIVRDLEKNLQEKEECVLTLQEEKREAIRQLCVSIDHHRMRSDFYKKTLTDITVGFTRRAG